MIIPGVEKYFKIGFRCCLIMSVTKDGAAFNSAAPLSVLEAAMAMPLPDAPLRMPLRGSHRLYNGFTYFHQKTPQMNLNTSPTCFEGPGGRKIGFRDPGHEKYKTSLKFRRGMYCFYRWDGKQWSPRDCDNSMRCLPPQKKKVASPCIIFGNGSHYGGSIQGSL